MSVPVLDAPSEEGVYADVPNDVYHADRNALSSSQARRLLKVAPAQFKYERDHPRTESTDYFDLGTAVHTMTLGVGPEIVRIDADSWRTKKAKDERAEAWAEGKTPVLPEDYALAETMAAALLEHPVAAMLLDGGMVEHSLYARDGATGLMLRARPDSMDNSTGRLIMVDVKTDDTADPDEFAWAAYKYGYSEQADFYRLVAQLLGLDHDPAFLFAVVAKQPPHLVSVIELTADALAYGARRNRRAIDLFARCRETNSWPGHGEDIHLVDLPRRAYYLEENAR